MLRSVCACSLGCVKLVERTPVFLLPRSASDGSDCLPTVRLVSTWCRFACDACCRRYGRASLSLPLPLAMQSTVSVSVRQLVKRQTGRMLCTPAVLIGDCLAMPLGTRSLVCSTRRCSSMPLFGWCRCYDQSSSGFVTLSPRGALRHLEVC